MQSCFQSYSTFDRENGANDNGFKNIEVSVCNMTVTQAREMLLEKSRSTISELSRTRIDSWISLLDELSVNPCLPFEAAYQEYAAKISTVALSQDQKSARVVFRHTLLSKSGLPVIIAHAKGQRYFIVQNLYGGGGSRVVWFCYILYIKY